MAIDQPSEKSIRFLSKHYGLTNPIPQINKFVVYPGFFENRDDMNRFNRRNKLESYSAGTPFNIQMHKGISQVLIAFSIAEH